MPTAAGRRNRWVSGNGVKLNAVTAGEPGAPPVLLLHGFPEFWYGWRHQIAPLGEAGFQVIALDQRGYNRSDKPPRVVDYAPERLVADVVACLDDLGLASAAVVGHDWGGAVAWALASLAPQRVSRLAVVNCPHPRVMQSALEGSVRQLVRSWYMFAAQIPGLPECVAEWTNYQFLTRSMRMSARPGTFTAKNFDRYRRAWKRRGAMTAMVNWYRAAARHPLRLPDSRIRVPTLLLWGQRDAFLGRELALQSAALCDGVRFEKFPAAGHWLLHEEPSAVNRILIDFLKEPAVASNALAATPCTGTHHA